MTTPDTILLCIGLFLILLFLVIAVVGIRILARISTTPNLPLDQTVVKEIDLLLNRSRPVRQDPPMWTYEKKTTTTTYAPRETKPTTGTKGAQPTEDVGRKPLPDDPKLSTKTH